MLRLGPRLLRYFARPLGFLEVLARGDEPALEFLSILSYLP